MTFSTSNQNLTGHERLFDQDDIIVSKTDLKGKLTYVNRAFMKISSLEEKQCIGKPHNIIRNPEMPKCIFGLLWNTLQEGKELFAYINNRARNGDHYWVFAHVTPTRDNLGNITGYHSNRRIPNRGSLNEYIIPLYRNLLQIENSNSSSQAGMAASSEEIFSLLKENQMSFNELMLSKEVGNVFA